MLAMTVQREYPESALNSLGNLPSILPKRKNVGKPVLCQYQRLSGGEDAPT
jgi:hypothetical protein